MDEPFENYSIARKWFDGPSTRTATLRLQKAGDSSTKDSLSSLLDDSDNFSLFTQSALNVDTYNYSLKCYIFIVASM